MLGYIIYLRSSGEQMLSWSRLAVTERQGAHRFDERSALTGSARASCLEASPPVERSRYSQASLPCIIYSSESAGITRGIDGTTPIGRILFGTAKIPADKSPLWDSRGERRGRSMSECARLLRYDRWLWENPEVPSRVYSCRSAHPRTQQFWSRSWSTVSLGGVATGRRTTYLSLLWKIFMCSIVKLTE